MDIQVTRYGKQYEVIGKYKIVKHKDDFIGIYEITPTGTLIVKFVKEWSEAVEFANNEVIL